MTIAALKSLHAIIGDAIADIERVYAAHRGGDAASGVMSGSGFSSPCSRTPEPQLDWEERMDGGCLKSKSDLKEHELENENEDQDRDDGDADGVDVDMDMDANLGLGRDDGARTRGIDDASSTFTATTIIPTTTTTTPTPTIPPPGTPGRTHSHPRMRVLVPSPSPSSVAIPAPGSGSASVPVHAHTHTQEHSHRYVAHRHSNSNSQAYVSPPPSPSTYTYTHTSADADATTSSGVGGGVETPAKNAKNKKEGDGNENGNGDAILENPRVVTTECTPPGTGTLHALSTSPSRRAVPPFSPVSAPLTCEAISKSLPQPVTAPAPLPHSNPPSHSNPPPPHSNPNPNLNPPPPPNPHTPDFPSLDNPYNPTSLSEALTAHPAVQAAICRIVAAAGQLAASVQVPFLTLCDASMGYHLPSCMRLMEASHVVEILREAGEGGMHVDDISKRNGVQASKLAHVLRLLATHHILREISPDVFALNRISSMVDSGKSVEELRRFQENGVPEMKYRDTNGVAAFVGLCTDEIQKASAYLTETYYLSSSAQTRAGTEPGKAPFCFAFGMEKRGVGFFGWLEGQGGGAGLEEGDGNDGDGGHDEDDAVETGRGGVFPPVLLPSTNTSSPSAAAATAAPTASDNNRTTLAPEPERPRKKDVMAFRHTNMPTVTKAESTSTLKNANAKIGKSQLTSRGYKVASVKLVDDQKSVQMSASAARSGSSTDSESASVLPSTGKRSYEKVDGAHGDLNDNPNRFRLERFGKAMSGTDGWEAPGAALNGFDWSSLPRGSVVVDVGGGIGSTSMLLATAFSSYSTTTTSSSSDHAAQQTSGQVQVAEDEPEGPMLRFVIQDRPVVCEMGEKAWKAKCPELLKSTARFQVHDFFTPQPITNAAVFLLRVVLHDWPDVFARKILLRLREAARAETKLVIADFVLPLACEEELGVCSDAGVGAEGFGAEKGEGGGGGEAKGLLDGIEGARTEPAPRPLLANLGKASANVYWMDLTMQVMFNSQERTLRELALLALSAGWKIVKVTRTSGSLFGYLVAVPVDIPAQYQDIDIEEKTHVPVKREVEDDYERRRYRDKEDMEMIERASSRCGTPTFGSNTRLSSVEEALARLGGGIMRAKTMGNSARQLPTITPLKPALSLSTTVGAKAKVKKKPSPLSVPLLRSGSSPSPSPVASPPPSSRNVGFKSTLGLPGSSQAANMQTTPPSRHTHSHSQSHLLQLPPRSPGARVIPRRMSLACLKVQSSSQTQTTTNPVQTLLASPQRQLLPSPLSPSYTHSSQAEANAQTITSPKAQGGPAKMKRRASYAHLSHTHTSSVSPGFFPPTSMIPVRVQGELHSQPPVSPGTGTSTGISARYMTPSAASTLASTSSASSSASASTASSIAGSPLPFANPPSHSHTPLPRGSKTLGPARRASNAHLTSMFAASALSPGGGVGRAGGATYRKRSGTVVVGPSISLRPGDAVVLRSAGDGEADVRDVDETEDERSARECGNLRGGTASSTISIRDMDASLHSTP
uniref:O-methyltransferase C-terminal domain-containing protein n=1 Tax=Psilocybe cubensis TaxID=181762 RepID=A0A8H8CE44_PSICU